MAAAEERKPGTVLFADLIAAVTAAMPSGLVVRRQDVERDVRRGLVVLPGHGERDVLQAWVMANANVCFAHSPLAAQLVKHFDSTMAGVRLQLSLFGSTNGELPVFQPKNCSVSSDGTFGKLDWGRP